MVKFKTISSASEQQLVASGFLSQAKALLLTGSHLADECDELSPGWRQGEPKNLALDTRKKLWGYTLSEIILTALAAEYALKALAAKTDARYKRSHDLYDLYHHLGDDVRCAIEVFAKENRFNSPAPILRRHRDTFVTWRYFPESQGLIASPSSLTDAVEVLVAVCDATPSRRA